MNAFIQFVTFEQGVEQLDLFKLTRCLLGKNLKNERYSWIGLNGRKTSVNSLAKLCAKAANVRFSQIGYEAKFKPFCVSPGITLKEAFGVMQIPRTGLLWAGSKYWERSNVPSVYRRARLAHRIEAAVERSKVSAFPAVFELTLKFGTRLKQDDLANALVERMSESFNTDTLKYLVCAVADFGDSMLFNKIEMLNLSAEEFSLVTVFYRFILGTPLIKTHIDRLHAVHILSQKPLFQIAQRLELSKPVRLGKDLGILVIPKKIIDAPDSNLRVAKFAIPKDDTTSWEGLVKRSGQTNRRARE